MRQQRRGRSIAMSPDEVNSFLEDQRVCRVASIAADGSPHVVPLWFVWDGADLWLNSIVRSQRWRDIERDSRISVVVDAGTEFDELRGVELSGTARIASGVPRTSEPSVELAEPERLYALKYAGVPEFVSDGRHAWLRLTPARLVSWDFSKNPDLRPRWHAPDDGAWDASALP